ncbi:glycoside hydrolase family 127 protein [Filimonas effusa]|uniref:Glycoside hydrolase family 127 protein n=1 Tax=Filimonas effusa TaxID=2508721 RepID=A0A4Q1DBJ6_9BACT|nr:glycoside hydrolase family 127 protein [Filimonas effusa]RXK86831.1 glycoside hydrolase family 127 protein [Filimonas effusa]
MILWNKIKLTLALLAPLCLNAQSHYAGQHAGLVAVADKLSPAVSCFNLNQVKLLDGRCLQNRQRAVNWLLSIDTKRLLHSFRTNAGIYSGNEGGYFETKKLAGWESLDCELRGHTTGHILSALALAYGATGDDVFRLKADSLVSGLAQVQSVLNQDGYLSAFPQELINRNLQGKKVWAPWYTLHKLLSGLIDQYLYTGNKQALDIAAKMAQWAYNKLQPVIPEQRTLMLRNEFGGISESFYHLYAITANPHHQWLAAFFYHNEALDPLREKQDVLDKKHANTYIPKLLGLTRDYEIQGKGQGDSIAAFFWQTVIDHHSFATGSNSDKEKFFQPGNISAHLSGYTGEGCNVYNMLKLSNRLFTHTADPRYAAYYEKALFNHIIGQQDPASGMVAYFLPMLPGAYKVYSTPDSSFWCCVGSGFENQVKYNEAIYYHTNDAVLINLFISSELNWKEKGLKLQQQTAFPENGRTLFTITEAAAEELSVRIRYPEWSANGAWIKLNGTPIKLKQDKGTYISLRRKWKAGDRIEACFPMSLQLIPANDNTSLAAIAYGPIVLAGRMGTDSLPARGTFSDPGLYNDYYTYNYHVPAGLTTTLQLSKQQLDSQVVPIHGKPLAFKTVKEGVILSPLYDIHRERYIVYWNLQ